MGDCERALGIMGEGELASDHGEVFPTGVVKKGDFESQNE